LETYLLEIKRVFNSHYKKVNTITHHLRESQVEWLNNQYLGGNSEFLLAKYIPYPPAALIDED